jgi:hypothetical protein
LANGMITARHRVRPRAAKTFCPAAVAIILLRLCQFPGLASESPPRPVSGSIMPTVGAGGGGRQRALVGRPPAAEQTAAPSGITRGAGGQTGADCSTMGCGAERSWLLDRAGRGEDDGCPRCRHRDDGQVRCGRQTRQDRPPPGAVERDRAFPAKRRDDMVRMNEVVTCTRYQRRFVIPTEQTAVIL